MRKTAIRFTILMLLCLSWIWAQDGQTQGSEPPAGQPQQSARQPQSLPPGPVGLQPDTAKPAAGPAPTDPLKMAAPPAAKPGEKIPGTMDVDKAYLIGPEDVLSVVVWGQPNLSGNQTVRPDGRISVPLAGEVQATGQTPQQLEAAIAGRLKAANLLVDPHVSVGLQAVHSKKYYIQGEVNRPGAFDLVVPITVMEALVSAGGFRDFANTKNIVIIRGSKHLPFNYKDAVSRNPRHPEQNVYLDDRDIIVVR